ncbi:protein kinase domain-containing protein [Pseudonocardia sp. CA-107938]|uniref:protein kinase domain-containing protein n=1 Tax=Pseudonocardia sp. CA-107938 TaxID=3240021 RepID=UPI003D8F6AA0
MGRDEPVARAERFGPYELVALLGRGGMGEVFRAFDTGRRRTVALKRLPRHLAGDPAYEARFRREAEVAARLTEPHIVPIHDFGEIDGQLFIDMRLVSGRDLGEVISRSGRLSAARAIGIIAQVASALAAAHAEGLVHRDVKPSNVLVSVNESGEDFVHLVDFGIVHDRGSTALTATGSTIGTIDYMAPERLLHEHCDHRVDVYSLGCVLHEALTGSKPFPVQGSAAKMYAHVHTPPPRPSAAVPGLPAGLDAVVATALAKDPDARYATATGLSAAAKACLNVPSRTTDPGSAEPTRTTEVPPPVAPSPPPTVTARPVPRPLTETVRAAADTDRHQPAPGARRRGPLIAVGAVLVAAATLAAAMLLSPRTETPIGPGGGDATAAASQPTAQQTAQPTPTVPPRNTYAVITAVDGTQTRVLPSSVQLCGSPMSDDLGFDLVRLEVYFVGPKAVAVRWVVAGREPTTEDVDRPCDVYAEDGNTIHRFDLAKVRSIAFRY